MVRLLIDENFDQRILRGLKLRLPQLDSVLVTQMGLSGSPDSALLQWAGREARTILTHDANTMIQHAKQFLQQGEPMAGVILVPDQLEIGRAIADLEILLECLSQSDLMDQIQMSTSEAIPLEPTTSHKCR
ncbi:MAG TPA: DUF5615 family PIN-like protein [Acidobacteriota bacterium]